MKTGIELITEERQRQIEVEGWSAQHDDRVNESGHLVAAALCYCMPNSMRYDPYGSNCPKEWPWEKKWWKPSPDNRIKELTKAGALIAAEIDRLQRTITQNPSRTEQGLNDLSK